MPASLPGLTPGVANDPFDIDGDEGAQANGAARWVERLARKLPIQDKAVPH